MIGGRIKAMLDGKGLSQRELARRIGKHPSEISEIVRGERDPGMAMVEKIAAGLGVSVAELVGQPGEIPVCEQLRAEIGEGGMWELLEWIRKIKRPPG